MEEWPWRQKSWVCFSGSSSCALGQVLSTQQDSVSSSVDDTIYSQSGCEDCPGMIPCTELSTGQVFRDHWENQGPFQFSVPLICLGILKPKGAM